MSRNFLINNSAKISIAHPSQTIVKDSVNLNPRQSCPYSKLLDTDESNLNTPDPEDDIRLDDPESHINLASMFNHLDEDFEYEEPDIMLMNGELRKVNRKNKYEDKKNHLLQFSEQQHQQLQSSQKNVKNTFKLVKDQSHTLNKDEHKFSLVSQSKDGKQKDYVIKDSILFFLLNNETGKKKIDAIRNSGDSNAVKDLCEIGFVKRVR